eukprot:GILK01003879.1.p1 GENE.GILK01003879.1~~GILK01003879.1.p1  ORF type:complete len:364 (+),score=49.81 GILK01003879.1:122-1093(+)
MDEQPDFGAFSSLDLEQDDFLSSLPDDDEPDGYIYDSSLSNQWQPLYSQSASEMRIEPLDETEYDETHLAEHEFAEESIDDDIEEEAAIRCEHIEESFDVPPPPLPPVLSSFSTYLPSVFKSVVEYAFLSFVSLSLTHPSNFNMGQEMTYSEEEESEYDDVSDFSEEYADEDLMGIGPVEFAASKDIMEQDDSTWSSHENLDVSAYHRLQQSSYHRRMTAVQTAGSYSSSSSHYVRSTAHDNGLLTRKQGVTTTITIAPAAAKEAATASTAPSDEKTANLKTSDIQASSVCNEVCTEVNTSTQTMPLPTVPAESPGATLLLST